MKKFIKWIDGYKSIIGLILLNVTQLSFVKQWLDVDLVAVQSIIGALTGASIIHHGIKRKFTDKTE